MVLGQPVPPQRGTYTAVGKREFDITSDAHGMTPASTSQSSSERLVLLGIAVVIALWALATTAGWTLPELDHGEHGDHARMPHPLSIAPFVMLLGAIAQHAGVRMPSFFGYVVKYSLPVLVPVFLLTMWIFLVWLKA